MGTQQFNCQIPSVKIVNLNVSLIPVQFRVDLMKIILKVNRMMIAAPNLLKIHFAILKPLVSL